MEQSKPQTLTDAVRSLLETNVPWLFIPGSLLLSVAGSAFYDLVRKPLGYEPSTPNLILVLIASLIGIVGIAWVIAKWFKRKLRKSSFVGGSALHKNRKAIIFTVGFQDATIAKAIQEQKPEFVGFLHSKDSKRTADGIVSGLGLEDARAFSEEIHQFGFLEAREATARLLKKISTQHKLHPHEIVVDLTGGTVPMSIGAFRAAEELGVDTQYFSSDYDKNKAQMPKELILVTECKTTT